MRREAYLTASAVVVLLLATLATLNRAKTLMMESADRAGVDDPLFQTVLAASHTLDSLVPVAFGMCAVGIVFLVAMGRR